MALLLGLASTLAALAALGYILVGPFYHESSVTSDGRRFAGHSHGLIAEGIEWPVALLLGSVCTLMIGVAAGAVLYFLSGERRGVLILRASTIALTIGVLVTFVAIGGLFAPAALLALAASAVARPATSRDGTERS